MTRHAPGGAPPAPAWTAARKAAALALAVLAVSIVAWHAVAAPWPHWPVGAAILLHGLLLWPVLAMLALRHRHALFAGAVACLVYFSLGVMETWANPAARGFALWQVALSLVVIAGASLDGLRSRFARGRGV